MVEGESPDFIDKARTLSPSESQIHCMRAR